MTEKPVIEFPCRYPIKIIVEMDDEIVDQIIDIVSVYDMGISMNSIEQNPSRNGKYVSIRYEFWATGKPQLEALFEDLKMCSAVRMVL